VSVILVGWNFYYNYLTGGGLRAKKTIQNVCLAKPSSPENILLAGTEANNRATFQVFSNKYIQAKLHLLC